MYCLNTKLTIDSFSLSEPQFSPVIIFPVFPVQWVPCDNIIPVLHQMAPLLAFSEIIICYGYD